MSIGNSDIVCVYESAVILNCLLDTINLDRDSEVYLNLKSCLNSLYESLPDKFTISFVDDVGSPAPASAGGDPTTIEG